LSAELYKSRALVQISSAATTVLEGREAVEKRRFGQSSVTFRVPNTFSMTAGTLLVPYLTHMAFYPNPRP